MKLLYFAILSSFFFIPRVQLDSFCDVVKFLIKISIFKLYHHLSLGRALLKAGALRTPIVSTFKDNPLLWVIREKKKSLSIIMLGFRLYVW